VVICLGCYLLTMKKRPQNPIPPFFRSRAADKAKRCGSRYVRDCALLRMIGGVNTRSGDLAGRSCFGARATTMQASGTSVDNDAVSTVPL